MRKRHANHVRACILLLFVLFGTFLNPGAQAQTTVQIGTGTDVPSSTLYSPVYRFSATSTTTRVRSNILFTQDELAAAGIPTGSTITAIEFYKANASTLTGAASHAVFMANTTNTSLATSTTWASIQGTHTQVYNNGTFTLPNTEGWVAWNLTPFVYTGNSLEIATDLVMTSGSAGADGFIQWRYTSGTPTDRIIGATSTTATSPATLNGTVATYKNRPNIRITFTAGASCTGTPNAGTANASKAFVCSGESFDLGVTGNDLSGGLTYQWQSSPDNSTWTNIPGANSITLTTSQTANTYYRLIVTCTGSGLSSNSSSILVSTPALVSGTFTINNNQPTGGTNFNSFADAYNYIKCGIAGPVVFNVDPASGPYTEQMIIDPVFGASATNTITFNGNGRTIQFTSANTNERAVIKLNGADHFIFDSLNVVATGTTTSEYGFGFQLLNDADSNIIRKCSILMTDALTSTNYAGISMSASATSATGTGDVQCDGNEFSNNFIKGGYYGITNVGSSTLANQNNKIINNIIQDYYLYGMYIYGSFNILIQGNDISRPSRSNLSTGTSYGIYFTNLNTKALINANRIHGLLDADVTSTNDVYGIYFTGVDALATLENIVSNNLIYDIKSNGTVYGIYNSSSDNVWYYHNTISLDDAGSTSTEVTRGFYQTTLAGGIEFRNNIITILRGGTGAKHGIYMNTATTTWISNNNNIYSGPLSVADFGFYNGNSYALLADWQTATSQDANSVSNDPFYTDVVGGNYEPGNSVIDNLGSPVGVLTDIQGDPRSAATPDMGAYEFAPPVCTSPPTPGTAIVSNTPVCENFTVALGATGYSSGIGQVYQWQASANIAGPYTNISGVLISPSFTITASETLYYRLAVTCSGNTQYSTPVLLEVTPALAGGTYTIDPSQPLSATNFTTFNEAKAAMACGISGPVVFDVEGGSPIFNEQLLLDSIPGTSSINTITFRGNGNTLAFSSPNSANRAVITLNGADYVTFENLIIDANGAETYGWGVHLTNGADSNTFRNNTIRTSTTSTSSVNHIAVAMSGSATSATSTTANYCDGNLFESNTVEGGYYGMTMVGNTTAPNTNNKFINNTVRDFYLYGIYVGPTDNAVIEGNDISRPTRTTLSTFYGVYFTSVSSNARVAKNRIHSPATSDPANTSTYYGIYFTSVDAPAGQPNRITNNVIYDMNGSGAVYGFYNSSSDYALYYHNSISIDNQSNASGNLARGFYQITLADGIEFKNNIISITRTGTGTNHGIYLGTSTTVINSNRNDIYVNSSTGTNHIGFLSSNRTSLADWQTASGQDANSVSVEAIYTDANNGNLIPLQALIDNIGEPVGVTTDILNNVRSNSTPDPGAHEFAVTPCTEPPTAGNSVATPNTGICLGATIQLTLAGNSSGGFQKYIWFRGASAAGPWERISDTLFTPDYDHELSSYANTFFRCEVICGSSNAFSTPVNVTINPALLAGDYTIDPASPASATNYQSFTTAVAALNCGIAGPVRFLVVPGTYTEQILINKVPGASATSRVTFMSQNGDPASVILTYDATDAALNYVLKFDEASFITFKDMTFTGVNASNGRVIEFARASSADSILNSRINAPASNSTSNTVAGIYGLTLTGQDLVFKGNTIRNGSSSIYLSGTAGSARGFVLDSNNVSGAYYYGMYLSGINDIQVSRNEINTSGILNTTSYGIYATNCDSLYRFDDNYIVIENVGTTHYGLYMTGCAASTDNPGSVSRNRVEAVNNNTAATMYGMYFSSSISNYTVNNIIDINSSGTTIRGLYSSGGGGIRYYNNTVRNASVGGTGSANVAGYFSQTSGTSGVTDIRNNIFAHTGDGVAVYQGNVANIYSDFNMYYTTGATLMYRSTVAYPNLQAWRDAENWDFNSIVYAPAFVTGSTLAPDINNPDVWAMHGRGVQITDNPTDYNGNARPTTLTSGVPDLGAYEFLPAVEPPVLPAFPATPAPGITQAFMFGTDTVSKVTWAPGSTVPASVSVRRYSGIIPPNLATGQQSMYFYTDVDITGSQPSDYTIEQFYIDPWMRDIPSEPTVKLGRTDATNVWNVSSVSTVSTFFNVMRESGLSFMDRFTGMTDGNAAPPPVDNTIITTDTSNRGRRFWVAYGHHHGFSTNGQDMVLYLSAEDSANVTVRVNGTQWVRNYAIPANTVRVSDLMPESGLIDARITDEGLFDRGISIESDVPIVAYAHIYQGSNSGASMLLPTGVYGYEYRSLNAEQYYPAGGAGSYSWFYVIADRDSTLVEITPSVTTKGGRPAGVPFQVYLNKGEVYNVMGTQTGANGTDLSGSVIKSIPNASGKCFPIAVFSGSSRTSLCNTTNGDNFIQQVFPNQAWGTRYLTFATANSASNTTYYSNKWRILVKDPATVVRRNGVVIDPATLNPVGNFYEFGITGGDGQSTSSFIEADQPIMVAQYMLSSDGTGCSGLAAPGGDGDPEMIYISPIEQGIKKAVFYNTDNSSINSNYINVILPTAGLASLRIDGVSSFTDVFAHPHLAGYTCVRHNLGGNAGQHIITSDSSFTAITYGLGSVESYGYNAGTLVKNLNVVSSIRNVLASSATSDYTCEGTPFQFSASISLKPTELVWQLSQVSGLSPNADVVQTNPVPVDSTLVGSTWYYQYTLPTNYSFAGTGTFLVPITISHPSIESCNSRQDITIPVTVIPSPSADFTVSSPLCVGETVSFSGSSATSNGVPVSQWTWTFGDGNTGNIQNPTNVFANAGTYDVTLSGVADDGCVGDTTKQVVINPKLTPAVVNDSIGVCSGSNATFTVQNPVAGATYNWYDAAVNGNLLGSGTSFTATNITTQTFIYVEAVVNGCASDVRKRVQAFILPNVIAPTLVIDSLGADLIRWRWNAVAGATSYEVSTDNGASWITPSSGATGLTHTVTGLAPLTTVTLTVRANGGCQVAVSAAVPGRTLTDQIYIPNSFTPNGDGLNDQLRVYGYIIREMRMTIYNQWGEKIFESRDQNTGWDGRAKGQLQPSGVYMYVCDITLNDGTRMQKKGSINLIR